MPLPPSVAWQRDIRVGDPAAAMQHLGGLRPVRAMPASHRATDMDTGQTRRRGGGFLVYCSARRTGHEPDDLPNCLPDTAIRLPRAALTRQPCSRRTLQIDSTACPVGAHDADEPHDHQWGFVCDSRPAMSLVAGVRLY
jgi:hypothetical protein